MRDYTAKTLNGIATQVAKDVYKKVGNRIAKDMNNAFKSAIRNFYADYQPKIYRRKYRSYFFADKSGTRGYTKYVKLDSDGKGFTVCLKVDPSNIMVPYTSLVSGKPMNGLNEIVFYNTWVLGQHGGKLPYDIIPELDRIPPEALSGRWTCLKTTGWTWNPPVTDPSPMKMMDEWFESYATNKKLDELTEEIVTSSINRYLAKYNNKYGNN